VLRVAPDEGNDDVITLTPLVGIDSVNLNAGWHSTLQLDTLSSVKSDDTHFSRRDVSVKKRTYNIKDDFSLLRVGVRGTLEGLRVADIGDEARSGSVRPRKARCRCTIVGAYTTDDTRIIELSRSKLGKGRVHAILRVEELVTTGPSCFGSPTSTSLRMPHTRGTYTSGSKAWVASSIKQNSNG
jgi:hypothetical protein